MEGLEKSSSIVEFRCDFARLEGVKIDNGILKGKAKIGRSGVQIYYDAQGNEIRELRLPEDVRNSVNTFSNLPLTLNHKMIDENNAESETRGFSSVCTYDAGWLVTEIRLHNKEAIQAALTTHRQFSIGYFAEVIPEEGVWVDSEGIMGEEGKEYRYDAIQKNHVGNHLALVPRARAGNEATFVEDASLTVRYDSTESYPIEINSEEAEKITVEDKNTIIEDKNMKNIKDMVFDMFFDMSCKKQGMSKEDMMSKLESMDEAGCKKYIGDMFMYDKKDSDEGYIEALKTDSAKARELVSELQASKEELTAKIDGLTKELADKTEVYESQVKELTEKISTECQNRLDAYEVAKTYLKDAKFDATFSPIDWKKAALTEVLKLDTAEMSDQETNIRFDTLTLIPVTEKVEEVKEEVKEDDIEDKEESPLSDIETSLKEDRDNENEFIFSLNLPQNKPLSITK